LPGTIELCGTRKLAEDARMNEMPMAMMWGMGIVWLLILTLLILGIAALIKYLRS